MSTKNAPPHWCASLRWKDYERDSADVALVTRAFTERSELYTCLITCQTAGWDDGLASPEGCGPQRSCYEEHPLLTLGRKTLV